MYVRTARVLVYTVPVNTIHAFDGRKDGRTAFLSLVRAGIPRSAEKIGNKINPVDHTNR